MNKTELIDSLSEETTFSKKDITRVLESFTRVIERALKKGEKVSITGFGTFMISKRAAVSLQLIVLLCNISILTIAQLIFDSKVQNYCPVSSLMDPRINGIHNYPMDIFDRQNFNYYNNSTNKASSNNIMSSSNEFNCTSSEKKTGTIINVCSSMTRCPMNENNIQEGIKTI